MIDGEVECSIDLRRKLALPTYQDRRGILSLANDRDQRAIVLLRHWRIGITPPAQSIRPNRRPPIQIDRPTRRQSDARPLMQLNPGLDPLLRQPNLNRRKHLPPSGHITRRLINHPLLALHHQPNHFRCSITARLPILQLKEELTILVSQKAAAHGTAISEVERIRPTSNRTNHQQCNDEEYFLHGSNINGKRHNPRRPVSTSQVKNPPNVTTCQISGHPDQVSAQNDRSASPHTNQDIP